MSGAVLGHRALAEARDEAMAWAVDGVVGEAVNEAVFWTVFGAMDEARAKVGVEIEIEVGTVRAETLSILQRLGR